MCRYPIQDTTVDRNRSAIHTMKTQEKFHQRTFARARRTHNACRLTRGAMEGQTVKDLCVPGIREGDMLKIDVTLTMLQYQGHATIFRLGRYLEQVLHTGQRGRTPLHVIEIGTEGCKRIEELRLQQDQ